MTESVSTDKLIALTHICDKVIDKLPPEKIEKIKTLKIEWFMEKDGYKTPLPLPDLTIEFHD